MSKKQVRLGRIFCDRGQRGAAGSFRLTYVPSGWKHRADVGPDGAQFFAFEIPDGFAERTSEELPNRPVVIRDRRAFPTLHAMRVSTKKDTLPQADVYWPHEVIPSRDRYPPRAILACG